MYKQLTREQRYVIYLGLQEKKTYSTIGYSQQATAKLATKFEEDLNRR